MGENMKQIKLKHEAAAKEKEKKLKQISMHKKRLKMMQYKKDVEDIIEERKRLKEMEKENQLKYDQNEKQNEQIRQEIIKKERLRLIKEHAPKLKHFLSTKMATNEEELELIKKYIM